ncbi:hypothetical protein [Streptomyces sp. NPDC003697]
MILTRDDTVKILDFGMGTTVDDPDQTRLTSTGSTDPACRLPPCAQTSQPYGFGPGR